ncbi:MAG: hypothetical protein ABH829_00925 [archaeon]
MNSRAILDHVFIVLFGVVIMMFAFTLFAGLERKVSKEPCDIVLPKVVSELTEAYSAYSKFDRTEYSIDLPQGGYTILVRWNVVQCVSGDSTLERETNINMGNFNLREGKNTVVIENA